MVQKFKPFRVCNCKHSSLQWAMSCWAWTARKCGEPKWRTDQACWISSKTKATTRCSCASVDRRSTLTKRSCSPACSTREYFTAFTLMCYDTFLGYRSSFSDCSQSRVNCRPFRKAAVFTCWSATRSSCTADRLSPVSGIKTFQKS